MSRRNANIFKLKSIEVWKYMQLLMLTMVDTIVVTCIVQTCVTHMLS